MRLPRVTRRNFLTATGGLAALGALGGGGYWLARRRIPVGIIGAGIRGEYLAGVMRTARVFPTYAHAVAICDVNRNAAEKVRNQSFTGADVSQDYRDVLKRKDIDAVVIAVPDHWHAAIAIEAMIAGKAVYCEKPLAATIEESKEVVAVQAKTKVPFLVGTMQRNDAHFRIAAELVRNGRLGKLKQIHVTLTEKDRKGGPFPAAPVPTGLDWDRWLGPAPVADFCNERFVNWAYFWDYGGGELTNWGSHHIDIAQWAMGTDGVGPIEVEVEAQLPAIPNGYEIPSHFTAKLLYPNGVSLFINTITKGESGVTFEGEKGTVSATRSSLLGEPVNELDSNPFPPDVVPLHPYPAVMRWTTLHHWRHFLDCVTNGTAPISDVESAHRTATTCNLSNIAMRLGRKIRWDPQSQQIIDDKDATAMLSRPRRPNYELAVVSS